MGFQSEDRHEGQLQNDDPVRRQAPGSALERYGQPHEIVALAAFLASDEASYIIGTTIYIDGGFSI